MREPIGMQRNPHTRDHAAEPGQRPQYDHVHRALLARCAECVHDLAEQNRLDEIDAGEREVRQREQDRENFFGRKQPDDTQVSPENRHAVSLAG